MNPLSRQCVEEITSTLSLPSDTWRRKAFDRLNILTKPLGSLGRLEELAAQMVSIREESFSDLLKKAIYIFAADHGITEEGVSAYPREVTGQMVLNFLAEGAAINVLARLHNAELYVVDVGVDGNLDNLPRLFHHKIADGTRNMLREPAMTDEQLAQALASGGAMAVHAHSAGRTIVAVGEMGIGNTTSASVITCALTGAPAELATGHGTGVLPEMYTRKIDLVRAIGVRHFDASAWRPSPFDILRCVGGFEIAAMVGMILAAATHKLIVVVDGFISTAAAALAVEIAPKVRGYLIAGHVSQEPGHKLLLHHLGLVPVLSLEMRLGEGTGAALAFPILESAAALYQQMATFDSAGVSGASS